MKNIPIIPQRSHILLSSQPQATLPPVSNHYGFLSPQINNSLYFWTLGEMELY